MPYKGEMELAFPQDEQRNVMIVFGDNMRGKTSILNAMRWAFYGEALGRHSRPIPLQEIVNKDAALVDDWRVEVHVKFDANGHAYDLRRVAERRNMVAKPSRPEDFIRSIHLTRDGSAVSGDQVEAEIGLIAPKQISRFFLFDGELLQEYETLLIEDSQQGQQIKEAIEQVLGVPALTNGRVDIQTILKQAQKRQNSDLKQIAGLEKQAERHAELTGKIDAIDRDLEDLNLRLKKVREERTALDDEVEAAQSVISAKATLDAKVGERKVVIDDCDRKEGERLDLISGAWKDLIDGQLQIRRDQLERRRRELVDSIKKRSALAQKVSDLKQLLDTRECPTCEQELSDERRFQIGQALGKAETDLRSIDDSSSALQDISGQLDALSKIRGINAKDRLRQVEKDLQGYNVRLTQIENDIERLRDEIAGYDTAEIARKRVLLSEKIKEEGRLQGDIQDQNSERKKLVDELAVSQKAIEGLTKDRTQRSTRKVSLCSDLERVFSESIEQLRSKLRKRVEERANDAFKHMTTQKSYRGLAINENYGLQIVDPSGRHVAVRSAGAEQIVALSLIDGLNRTGRAAGPVIMDTPFGRLDLNHRDNILSYLPSVTSQFVLLVHSGEIRKETDLAIIAERIGAVYEIREISSTQSRLERTTL
ncbi:chromosome segregation protein [Jannaschia rubra]|uniref:Chromosome segregation protein n=2 Tax=Jannaschia rubra TaxID=282197 RepID=A0A0M6XUC5_9RHOB|nr:chromosome segregation protein [Jannaschia rubra]SFG62800.1 DNA sulfur modification protein DndD [Jannaschia rubra]